MNPRLTALVDQANAAAADAEQLMYQVAELTGGEINYSGGGQAGAAMLSRLFLRFVTRQINPCPHVSLTSPQPAHWLAYAPGRLRCADCAGTVADRIKGTREDHRCDLCKTVVPPPFRSLHPTMAALPPIVVDGAGEAGGALCIPPIILHYGLCHVCHVDDQLARGADEGEASDG